jgi:hypothetical protein
MRIDRHGRKPEGLGGARKKLVEHVFLGGPLAAEEYPGTSKYCGPRWIAEGTTLRLSINPARSAEVDPLGCPAANVTLPDRSSACIRWIYFDPTRGCLALSLVRRGRAR